MSERFSVKTEGFRELDLALMALPKATSKRVAKKALMEAAKPIAAEGAAAAPVLTGGLRDSYGVGVKLTRRQKKASPKQSPVEVYVGPNNPAAVQTEFGNEHQAAEPHLRPAWDANRDQALETIKSVMWAEIEKAAARAARKAARLARKAGG